MRHQAFFETIAASPDGTPGWELLAAGYFVMRLFDDFLRLGPVMIATDRTTARIQKYLDALSEQYPEEIVKALDNIIDALLTAPDMEPRSVASPVLAYARLLQDNGQWTLAADVYETVAESFEILLDPSAEDWSSAGDARRKEGLCLRHARDYLHAERAYTQAIVLAKKAKNDTIYLQGKLGLAAMARVRGNLPDAEKALNALLAECDRCSRDAARLIRPDILHARGSVRHDREQYQEAITDFFAAYKTSTVSYNKEIMLADIGVCAGDAGYRKVARDALGIVVLKASRPLIQQIAIINLMNIATLDNDQVEFEWARTRWQSEYCSPLLNANAKLFIARGLEKFGTREEALDAFLEAVRFAEEVEVHKAQFEALHDLERLERSAAIDPSTCLSRPIPKSLAEIADELSHIHILVLTGHTS